MEPRETKLPDIPAKHYFTIGEVSELCGVKSHVLRYWEQEFTQLKPMKRRGNRRYYQHHEVLLIRRIRDLLYDQGFTINGARSRLGELSVPDEATPGQPPSDAAPGMSATSAPDQEVARVQSDPDHCLAEARLDIRAAGQPAPHQLREELLAIRALLG
jgi:DNA-binding transcriptional MerR regulator